MYNERETQFLQELEAKLIPYYTPPACPGGHDFLHVKSMIQLGSRIQLLMSDENRKPNLLEYDVTCWLHNIDRPHELNKEIGGDKRKLADICYDYLSGSPLSTEQRLRIVDAVIEHPKFKDDLDRDSSVLTAIRIADKVVRLGPDGIVSAAAFRGPELLAYNPNNPFGYQSTVEGKLKTVYNDFMRVLEWYEMLPFDWARDLVRERDMNAYLSFVRSFGRMIAQRCDVMNKVEEDIQRALGKYYKKFNPYIGIEQF